jgi:biotin carboxyl carrier protein
MKPDDIARAAARAPVPSSTMAGGGPGAMRVSVGPATRVDGDPTIVVGRSAEGILIDGSAASVRLSMIDGRHATLTAGEDPVSGIGDESTTAGTERQGAAGSGGGERGRTIRLVLGSAERRAGDGVAVREVVVGGWRVVVEIEPEARASLRERARRGLSEGLAGGPVDVRAIIPGRIAAVSVASGDAVTAGQQMLVLEAMKMQNELRAPRDGTVDRIAVEVGENVEVGDLLLVIR